MPLPSKLLFSSLLNEAGINRKIGQEIMSEIKPATTQKKLALSEINNFDGKKPKLYVV